MEQPTNYKLLLIAETFSSLKILYILLWLIRSVKTDKHPHKTMDIRDPLLILNFCFSFLQFNCYFRVKFQFKCKTFQFVISDNLHAHSGQGWIEHHHRWCQTLTMLMWRSIMTTWNLFWKIPTKEIYFFFVVCSNTLTLLCNVIKFISCIPRVSCDKEGKWK